MEINNNLIISTVDYSEDLTDCYKARYLVYCLFKKWLKPEECPGRQEKDIFDAYSKHIIILDMNGKVKGYTRLIQSNQNIDLPIVYHPGVKDFKLDQKKSGEASRFIALDTEIRTALTYILLRSLYQQCMINNYDNCYIVVEPSFLRYLRKIGYVCTPLSEPKLYFGDETIPVRVGVKETDKNLKKMNNEYGNWFLNKSGFISENDFIFRYLYHVKAA